jgi:hypothetical protein
MESPHGEDTAVLPRLIDRFFDARARTTSGNRTARLYLRVDTLISIRFMAHWPNQSSSTACSQLASGSSFPSSPRTRGRSIATLPAWKPILPAVRPQR